MEKRMATTIIGRMDERLSWRTLAVPVVVALALWYLFLLPGGRIRTCLTTPCPPIDNFGAIGAGISHYVLGAVVIVAIAYCARLRSARPDLIALAIWTVSFALIAPKPPGNVVCPDQTDRCYVPWTPLIPPMLAWFLVSAGILTVGYLIRRAQSARSARALP
jgi:hypothetical protein